MNRAFEISEIRDFGGMAALEPEWWELWRRAPEATPFQSPAWLIPWWQTFVPGSLCVVAIRREGGLVGLAPLYIEEAAAKRLLPLGISISDYNDVLFDPAIADEAGDALVTHLDKLDWDEWELAELAPRAAALRIAVPSSCEETVDSCNVAPVLELAGAGTLAELLPCRKRRSLRMAKNRAARRGETTFAAADLQSASAMLQLLIRLHAARWQSQNQTGVLADPRLQRFHAAALPRLMRAGLARLYLLRLGGSPAAIYYGFHHRGRGYAYLTGFDPEFSYESPGALLLAHAIEQAMAEGGRVFHFLRGGEAYKYGWGAEDRPNLRRVFRRAQACVQAS